MNNILIGICCGGTIHAETVTSLVSALKTLDDRGINHTVAVQTGGGYKPHNLNELVATAQKLKATHFMSIDADMIFPHDGIARLLEHDKEIVGANYKQRGNPIIGDPKSWTVKVADDDGNLIATSILPKELFECWALGLGFTLIQMSVFNKLDKPYFRDFESPEGEHHTEDMEFFAKCQHAGLEVWCDPRIQMGHIGMYTY